MYTLAKLEELSIEADEAAARRDTLAIALLNKGCTYEEVGHAVGVTRQAAWDYYRDRRVKQS